LHVGCMEGREEATNRKGGYEREITGGEGMVKERKASGKVVGPSEGHSQTPCLP